MEEFGLAGPPGLLKVIFSRHSRQLLLALSFQWPIYTGGRTDALQRAAEAEARAVRREVQAARADLRLEVIRAYWALATATDAARPRGSRRRAEAHLSDVRSRFDTGLIPPNDVSSAEASVRVSSCS